MSSLCRFPASAQLYYQVEGEMLMPSVDDTQQPTRWVQNCRLAQKGQRLCDRRARPKRSQTGLGNMGIRNWKINSKRRKEASKAGVQYSVVLVVVVVLANGKQVKPAAAEAKRRKAEQGFVLFDCESSLHLQIVKK